jgi:hypothetical protein
MPLKGRFLQLTLTMLTLAVGIHAEDRANCSDATLHGSYGLHATGTVPDGVPFAAVGRFTFDGAGHLTGKELAELTSSLRNLPEPIR